MYPDEKDLNMIKAAIRRVFSRSKLRQEVLNLSFVPNHIDEGRKRVKRWYKCQLCSRLNAGYEMQVDHKYPVVLIYETLKDISVEDLIRRVWCDKSNLQAICLTCHKEKSKIENRQRREHKKTMSTAYNNRKKFKKLVKKAKEKESKDGK